MDLINLFGKQFILAGVGGIGLETALLLSEQGAKMVLVDINTVALQSASEVLKDSCIGVFECDFSDVSSIGKLVKTIGML